MGIPFAKGILKSKTSIFLNKKTVMKKTMIIMAALFFSIGAAKAQGVHFGIKAGMNASELHSSDFKDGKTKIGFHGGVLAHIHTANKSWAIQPEVMYSLEGSKYDILGETVKTDLDYVNVPVLVQYMFDNGFRIEAGPQIGFLVNAKSKFGDSDSKDVKSSFKSTNFSIPVGVGYLTRSGLGFDARYNFGVSDINDVTDGNKVTSNNFQFGIFYQFSDTKMK